jgi:bifunctional non-homologous end joining protein LigD
MALEEYKRKRDFKKTAEPAGKPLPKKVKGASRFVIQKHAARRLHYDFRLEMDGVLKSWALPKGLPWKRGEKHLAVEVEDHPIEYEDFEGLIPEGQYGGGTVMLWDRGNYHVYGEQPVKSLRDGKLHLVLDGEKAKGEWTLVRIHGRDDAKNQWLILKTGADAKPPTKKREDQSVKTGRTMKQIAEARDAEWESNREEKDASATSRFKTRIREAIKKKANDEVVGQARRLPSQGNRSGRPTIASLRDLPSAKARFVEPMKAKLVGKPPATGDWIYELKFDGIRLIAVKRDKKVSLFSRNQNDLSARFSEIVEAIKNLPAREGVVDGEVVALDEEGRSSFQLLQAREMEGRKSPIYFYAFDLLQFDGKSLIGLPLEVRKNVLEKLCASVAAGPECSSPIRYSGAIGSNANRLLEEVKRRGLEGIIGKQRNSVYEPGRRSGAWIKLKCVNEQEFVVGGYTPPQGARKHFGAILVGYYDNNKLMFAGKVGTGFTAKSLSMLHKKFQKEARDDCPFVDLPSKQNGQWVQGITPSMMKKMHWVNPKFVAQIKFAEWTRDGKLRAPVFLGLREDKRPGDVVREG